MGINWSLDYIAGEQYSFQFLKKDTFEMHVHLKGPKKKKKGFANCTFSKHSK